MDYQYSCRMCLIDRNDANGTIFSSIFDENLGDLVTTIYRCIAIKVSKHDTLPSSICHTCLKKLYLVDKFLIMCHNSEAKLREIYNTKSNVINPEEETILADYQSPKKKSYLDSDRGYINKNMNNEDDDYSETLNVTNTSWINGSHEEISQNENSSENMVANTYECEICALKFKTFFDYHDHQYMHDGSYVFKCVKCNEVFDSRDKLVVHDGKHKVHCEICDIEILPKSMTAHLLIHTDTYKCIFCETRHASQAALDKHVTARHSDTKGFICYICGKQNSCQSSMKRHLAYHATERPHKCLYCDFCTKSSNILRVHTTRKHFAEKCVCEICAQVFKSQPSLSQHMKRIHSSRKYICDTCGKAFAERYNLNKHARKHTKQILHECKICRKEFLTVRNLKSHMHSHRTGCVNCPGCGKQFYYKKYYQKHVDNCQSIKNNEKP